MRVFNDVDSSATSPDKPLNFLILGPIVSKMKKNALTTRARAPGSIEKLIAVESLYSFTFYGLDLLLIVLLLLFLCPERIKGIG